jgi:hypothetical protein
MKPFWLKRCYDAAESAGTCEFINKRGPVSVLYLAPAVDWAQPAGRGKLL